MKIKTSRRCVVIGASCLISEYIIADDVSSKKCLQANNMLNTATIRLSGDWGAMLPEAVLRVVNATRHACLDGVMFHSDGQPSQLLIDRRDYGPPAIWLHEQPIDTAWIVVNIGERDWSKLAYQVGHELGHTASNSWKKDSRPMAPCQWLEEALVEAFSLRGLARLADKWSLQPPFIDDTGFGAAIAVYRQNIIQLYGKIAKEQGYNDDFRSWFSISKQKLEVSTSLDDHAKVASLWVLERYEENPESISGLGALNKWPERSSLSLSFYLQKWIESCKYYCLSPHIPDTLIKILNS